MNAENKSPLDRIDLQLAVETSAEAQRVALAVAGVANAFLATALPVVLVQDNRVILQASRFVVEQVRPELLLTKQKTNLDDAFGGPAGR